MRLVILTTYTPHHVAFVRALARSHPIKRVVLETNVTRPSFDTAHSFEERRDGYEWRTWFAEARPEMRDFADTISFENINDPECIDQLNRVAPDVLISFGTGKLKSEVLSTCPDGALNLHGGDPERYRGLDSHLWSIYHRDAKGLITTLHRLNEKLDDGQIIQRQAITPPPNSGLHELRGYNTEVCIGLVSQALEKFSITKKFESKPQQKIGRYYSFMPAVLKELCVKRYPAFLKAIA